MVRVAAVAAAAAVAVALPLSGALVQAFLLLRDCRRPAAALSPLIASLTAAAQDVQAVAAKAAQLVEDADKSLVRLAEAAEAVEAPAEALLRGAEVAVRDADADLTCGMRGVVARIKATLCASRVPAARQP